MHDWTALEAEYITTKTSYRKLAEKYGISSRTITDYAKKHNWVEKRKRYCGNVVAETVAHSTKSDVNKLVSLIESADTMAGVINAVVSDTKQFNRHIVQKKEGHSEWSEERVFKKADTKAIRDIVASLKDLTSVIRNLNDIPTMAESEAMALASKRFELDKQKADLESGENKEIKVTMSAEAEEYSQ